MLDVARASDDAFQIARSIAARHGRVVTRQQLTDAGVDSNTIQRLRKRGYLVDVFRGVYLVGYSGMSHREFLHACVLRAGPFAWPASRTGLELRGIIEQKTGHVSLLTTLDIETPLRAMTPLEDGGFGFLNTTMVGPTASVETEVVTGFHTTLLPRTIVDFAADAGAFELKKAWREATFRSLLDPTEIEHELATHRRAGTPLVRERLKNAYPVTRPGMVLRSKEGELRFLEVVRELGLPEPLVNVWLNVDGARYRADFYWELIGLVIETDGRQHELEWHQEADGVRAADLFVTDIDVLHLPNRKLDSDPEWYRRRLRQAYDRQARRAALLRKQDSGL